MVRRGETAEGRRTVHNRVKVLRVEMGLSRAELADALGIGYRTLGYIEREDYNPSLALAWRVARFFDLPTDAVWSPEPIEPIHKQLYGKAEQETEGGRGRLSPTRGSAGGGD